MEDVKDQVMMTVFLEARFFFFFFVRATDRILSLLRYARTLRSHLLCFLPIFFYNFRFLFLFVFSKIEKKMEE